VLISVSCVAGDNSRGVRASSAIVELIHLPARSDVLQSSAFGSRTKLVRIETDSICSIAFGSNPTATTARMRMAADTVEYFVVNSGDKVAVIANT
jgi:hypothetical protein